MGDVMPPPATGGSQPAGLDDAITTSPAGTVALTTPAERAVSKYEDDAFLLKYVADRKRIALSDRWIFERSWWRNILYVLGRQWITYDKKRGQWADKRLARWVPKPVTNKTAEAVEALQAVFQGIEIAITARPLGEAPEHVAAAEIADKLFPFIRDGHRLGDAMSEADWWMIVTGNAFLHTFWDREEQTGTFVVKYEECLQCATVSSPAQIVEAGNVCPNCQSPALKSAVDPETGQPLQRAFPMGRGRTEALSPFEVAFPSTYKRFADVPYLLRMRFRPREWYEDHHPDLAKKLFFEKTPTERSLQLLRAIASQADTSAFPLSAAGGGAEGEAEGISEFEFWSKPCRDFPEGLFVRIAGDGTGAVVVRGDTGNPGPLPNKSRDDRPIFPFIHMPYQAMGGRTWARSPLDLTNTKQDQINRIDSHSELAQQRMSNPIWLEPKGAEVRSFTGEPGLIVKYSPFATAAGVAKPERIPGESVPQSNFQLRAQHIEDFENLAGTFDVLKGAKPSGVEAFSALQLLVERGQARLAKTFASRGNAVRDWYEIALELERSYGPTERVYSVTSPNNGWTFHHFEMARLDGAIEIRVEDGTKAPKTNLGERAAIEHAGGLGLINPQDQEQQYTLLTRLGLSYLKPSLDYDVKSALQEQDAFERWSGDLTLSNPQALQILTMQWQAETVLWQQEAAEVEQRNAQREADAAAAQANQAQPGAQAVEPTMLEEVPQQPQLPEATPFVIKPQHNHAIHYAEHRKWGNSDRARELFAQRPELEVFYHQHLLTHQQQMYAEMAQQAAAQQPPKQGGAVLTMRNSNRESGSTSDVPSGSREGAQRAGPR